MRSNGTRATEWPYAEYEARKRASGPLARKSDSAATNGHKKAESASTALEMDFGDKANPARP